MKRLVYFAIFIFQLSIINSNAAFEPLGFGARAKGMGEAFTAVADDASAVYWNPAGIGSLNKKQLAVSYEDLFDLGLLRYNTLSYIQPGIGGGVIGLSLLRLETFGEADFLDYAENTFIVSYGKTFLLPLSAGVNFRYYSVSYDKKASGIGFDAGILYQIFKEKLVFGTMLQDLNEPAIHWETQAKDRLPWTLRSGLASKWNNGLLSMEYQKRRLEKQSLHVGGEYCLFNKFVILRCGGIRREEWHTTCGFGLNISNFRLDSSWTQNRELGDTLNFSFLFRF